MIDHLRGMGIDVITDENEAQRILEKANKKGIKVRTEGDDDVREQKAYHNSPADFDKFDTQYVKEDNVQGWGIYVSKNDIPLYAGEKEGERNKYIVDIPSNKHLLNLDSTDFYDLQGQLKERGIELDKKYLNQSYYLLTIQDYYDDVAEELGSQKAASEFIASLGYKGMRYKDEDDGVCYVIFDENDAKITEDFYKPKIVWKIIGNRMGFTLENEKHFVNNACYILTGKDLEYMLAFFNSNAILWYSFTTNMNKTGVGDVQVGAQNVLLFPIPQEYSQKSELIDLVNSIESQSIILIEEQIEGLVCEAYGLTEEEKIYLSSFAKDIYG